MLDFGDVKEDSGFGLIPKGIYKVVVYDAEFRQPRAAAKKEYINLEFKVTEGDFEGRKVWNAYNVYHENQKTRNIAMSQLKRLMVQAGKPNPEVLEDVKDLIGLECYAEISIQESNNGYPAKNTIGKFAATPKASGATTKAAPKGEDVPF